LRYYFWEDHRKVIEKTLPEKDLGFLGIVPLGGDEVSIGGTDKDFELTFSLPKRVP
jgi:hypothetical protein